ncbi:MAG: hypothetical protein WCD26_10440, partial [Pseudolabrys sp.]
LINSLFGTPRFRVGFNLHVFRQASAGAGQETTLPSMIAAVRGQLACGEVFPDGATLTILTD